MARIYVGRLRDGDTTVEVVFRDALAGAPAERVRPPAPDRSVLGAFDLAPHVRRLDAARDEDLADLLCDLIECGWDERALRQ